MRAARAPRLRALPGESAHSNSTQTRSSVSLFLSLSLSLAACVKRKPKESAPRFLACHCHCRFPPALFFRPRLFEKASWTSFRYFTLGATMFAYHYLAAGSPSWRRWRRRRWPWNANNERKYVMARERNAWASAYGPLFGMLDTPAALYCAVERISLWELWHHEIKIIIPLPRLLPRAAHSTLLLY